MEDARFGVGPVYRFMVEGLACEGEAVAEIAVVWDGQNPTARFLLIGVHVLPQSRRVLAIEGGEWDGLLCPLRTVAENDGAVKIVPVGHGSPFEAVERGEDARLVV